MTSTMDAGSQKDKRKSSAYGQSRFASRLDVTTDNWHGKPLTLRLVKANREGGHSFAKKASPAPSAQESEIGWSGPAQKATLPSQPEQGNHRSLTLLYIKAHLLHKQVLSEIALLLPLMTVG